MAFPTIGSLQIKIGFIAFGEFNLKFLVDSAFSHSWKIKWGDFKSIPFHLKTFWNNFTQFDIMLGLRPELILICGTFVLNWHFYNYPQSAKSCRELKINNFKSNFFKSKLGTFENKILNMGRKASEFSHLEQLLIKMVTILVFRYGQHLQVRLCLRSSRTSWNKTGSNRRRIPERNFYLYIYKL